MKKWSKTCLKIVGLTLAMCTLFTGCAGREVQYEVSSYQGQLADGEVQADFNKELFYRNDKQTSGADPFVLNNTEVDGYYYMYYTVGRCFCYRSTNLMDWEPVGNTLGDWQYKSDGTTTEELNVFWTDIWAPEVVYDADTELYYMFFSATPKKDESVEAGKGVEEGTPSRVLMVATSKYPDRDFRIVNFKDAASCGQENLHTYSESKYPHYYAKYFFLDPEANGAFCDANGGRTVGSGGYTGGIDPHPFVDDNGDKYYYWKIEQSPARICVVKMENWLKPDWSTATVLTCYSYYTIEDWKAAEAGEAVEKVTYEETDNNEGPEVIKHNGKYYLTYSMNTYQDNRYQVGMAVADSAMGPFRKLTEEEGGLLLSGRATGSQEISGTGHHSFVTVGEQLYIIYHRHDDFVTGGGARNHAIDEVKWIKIKDKDGNDLDVMYVNGPTCTVQPRIEGYSDYKNIADEAEITVEKDMGVENISCLNDGLLSTDKYANENFMQYIKETSITEKTTFTFDFDAARTVRAIMIYNSKVEYNCFENISKIEFVCEENGEEVIRYIENVEFSLEGCKVNDYDGAIYYVTPGAAAYAEFEELNVKTVRIIIDVPEGQENVGISEVRILGK